MNKKIGMFALAALVLGAGVSIAVQSFAQTPSSAPSTISASTDQSIDQKDQNGNDFETTDDATDVTASGKGTVTEMHSQDAGEQGESADDADGGASED